VHPDAATLAVGGTIAALAVAAALTAVIRRPQRTVSAPIPA
jgi:hypothetical protein